MYAESVTASVTGASDVNQGVHSTGLDSVTSSSVVFEKKNISNRIYFLISIHRDIMKVS